MSNLGFSVYCSTFKEIETRLPSYVQEGALVFTSLHIAEEMNESYFQDVDAMLKSLKKMGFKIVCDVSKKTLEMFNYTDILKFKEDYGIDYLRIDYGFNIDELINLAQSVKICLNASTITEEECIKLLQIDPDILFIHNYYPRPETGLDGETFDDMNAMLIKHHAKIMAFINGNEVLRGPLHEGLVTLEQHRYHDPYVNYLDLCLNHGIENILVGDSIIDMKSFERITLFNSQQVITLPVVLDEPYHNLYNKKFTIRSDSPKGLKRLAESRGYAVAGERIKPDNCISRKKGSIVMDNERYLRYSGEIMITAADYPQDDRVNVIGEIHEDYLGLLDCIKNGCTILFIKP